MTYTIAQITEITGRDPCSIRLDRRRGKLYAQKEGRSFRITPEELSRYLEELAAEQNQEVIAIVVNLLDIIDKVIGEKRMDTITDEAIEAFQEVVEKAVEKLIKA